MSGAQVGRPDQFFRAGLQYYVQGRNALLCGYESVAGSSFHQGFEVMFKAALLEPIYKKHSPGWEPELPEARRRAAVDAYTTEANQYLRGLSHDLGKCWDEFKALHSSIDLSAFDEAIRGLHRWWRLRYPGFPEGLALEIRTNIVCSEPTPARSSGPGQPYELCLEDMDRMFQAVAPLEYSGHALLLAIGGRRESGRGIDTYETENLHKVW
jgi:hypothetical protein